LAKARDYPERAREAIAEMHRQVGPLRFGPDGVARRGVLVRHLVMPDQASESNAIFEWLAAELSPDTFVNIMGQYRPLYQTDSAGADGRARYPEIDRQPEPRELRQAHDAARRAGLWRFAA
jgi:putative pyruvate formate lyase activating enzyme